MFREPIPLTLAAKADELAAQHDQPRGRVVKQALAGWIAHEEAYRQYTLEGLADVAAGRFVSQEEMEGWADGRELRGSWWMTTNCNTN